MNVDFTKSSFIAFDYSTKTIAVQTKSVYDIGNYDYKVYFELSDYPSVSKSVPLNIIILRQPSKPISVLPKPNSAYTIAPG